MRVGWCPGALRPMRARDGLVVRLRPSGGIVSAATAHRVADLAERHGSGAMELTGRANLQLRGVREAEWPALIEGLRGIKLLDADPAAEAVRNIVASPLAGLGTGPDTRPLVAALEARLGADAACHALPAKFGFVVADGGEPSPAAVAADVCFAWRSGRFTVSLGGTGQDAWHAGHCPADALPDRALALALAAVAARRRFPGEAPRRLWTLLPVLTRGERGIFGIRDDAPRPVPPAAEPVLAGVRRHGGVAALGLALPFGRCDAAMLRRAADLAEAAGNGELRLTPWRTLLLPLPSGGDGIDLAPLAASGFVTDPADPRLRVVSCAGEAGCARGSVPALADAAALAPLVGCGEGVVLHVSGCGKGCARPAATPLTLVGRDGRYDLVRDGRPADAPALRGLSLPEVAAVLRGAA